MHYWKAKGWRLLIETSRYNIGQRRWPGAEKLRGVFMGSHGVHQNSSTEGPFNIAGTALLPKPCFLYILSLNIGAHCAISLAISGDGYSYTSSLQNIGAHCAVSLAISGDGYSQL